MRLLFANTSDIDGGAAKAAYRLFEGMRDKGHDAKLFVQHRKLQDNAIICKNNLKNKLIKRIGKKFDAMMFAQYPQRRPQVFSISYFGNQDLDFVNQGNTDILHFHWINNNFLSVRQFANIQIPSVFFA